MGTYAPAVAFSAVVLVLGVSTLACHLACCTPQLLIYAIVDLMDNIGFFETKSGRDAALHLLKTSLVPVTLKRRNDTVCLDFVQSPYYRGCIEAIEEITRTSFAYDEKGNCVTVNDADVRRIAGLPPH